MNKLLIIDLSNIIYRTFFGMPVRNQENPVNAINGTFRTLEKIQKEFPDGEIILTLESKKKLKRKDIYPEYKATRKPMPEALKKQFNKILDMIKEKGYRNIKVDHYEADDVIGSICHQWYDQYDELVIFSTDKDLLQFLNKKTYMYNIFKNRPTFIHEVKEVFGVNPDQISDYLSLVGDKADNIPGVPSVGPKTAAKLLLKYKTLDNLIKNIDNIEPIKLKDKLKNNLDKLELSRQLVKIHTDLILK